jgi:alpha-ribazole phosphatase
VTRARWHWVRHAPVLDPDGILYGRLDLPADLSDRARIAAQAALLPRGALWIESPSSRARQTGAALRAALGEVAVPLIEPDFVEQDLGAWQGRPAREVYAAMPADHPFWRAPATSAPPGGESFAALAARVRAAIRRHAGRHGDREIVVVAHAGPIRAAAAMFRGLDDAAALAIPVEPLSVTSLCSCD